MKMDGDDKIILGKLCNTTAETHLLDLALNVN